MDTPICLSQYFVNKQNVRSYGNINRNLSKCEGIDFYKQLFASEEYLAKSLTDELLYLISTMKTKTEVRSKNDFKEVFLSQEKKLDLQPVQKDYIFEKCWKAIHDIIPGKLIGGNHNHKLARRLVQFIIYSMKRQHITLSKYIEKWNFSGSPWQSIPNMQSKHILYYILLWIVKNILSAIISLNFYVTTCKLDLDENKLHYFWKPQWQSFFDKKMSDMIFTGVVKKSESISMGKKLKKHNNITKRLQLKSVNKEIPKLHLVLKTNNECRPIVRYRNDSQNISLKYKTKERTKFLKILTSRQASKLETEFMMIHQKWLALNKPKLYFIKTDLSNAFGSVSKDKLLKILSERHIHYQTTEKNVVLKKRMAQLYTEIITELKRPLLVRAGSTIFEWQEGLVQGYKHSPALSELYYNHMDEIYFTEHLKQSETKIKLFTRVVDDYLYITDSLNDAQAFLNALSNYRNVNYRKTVVNFEHPNITYSEEITFLGYSYNTRNLEVSRAPNIYFGQMCYKIAFTSAISNVQKFLENRIGQSGIQINGHIFNFFYNSEELIWKHIFMTVCLSANKFCTVLAILCDETDMLNYLIIYKKQVVVKLCNSILESLLRNKPANFQFVFCINHFRYLSWQALYLCAKETPQCFCLVPHIKDELTKTNCLFGKWREHASSIHSNGEPFRAAVKEICRRTDLRTYVKIFDHLPEGFECYNYRKIINKTT